MSRPDAAADDKAQQESDAAAANVPSVPDMPHDPTGDLTTIGESRWGSRVVEIWMALSAADFTVIEDGVTHRLTPRQLFDLLG